MEQSDPRATWSQGNVEVGLLFWFCFGGRGLPYRTTETLFPPACSISAIPPRTSMTLPFLMTFLGSRFSSASAEVVGTAPLSRSESVRMVLGCASWAGTAVLADRASLGCCTAPPSTLARPGNWVPALGGA